MMMRIAVGADHAGFPMKDSVIAILKELGIETVDHGTYSEAPVDFPIIARKVCDAVLSGAVDRGVLVCGTGIGASIAANKIPGIRAGLIHDVHCAHQAVEHDDVNVLCMGAKIIGSWLAADILKAFVEARFSTDPDCRRRVALLREMDEAKRCYQ